MSGLIILYREKKLLLKDNLIISILINTTTVVGLKSGDKGVVR
jgi:hypothetical protein